MNNSKAQKIKKKVKNHIPKDWLTEIRIVYRMSVEIFNDIKRTGWINLAIITTMAAILTLFGSLLRTTLSVSSFAHELGNVLEISVYLKSNADANIVSVNSKDRKADYMSYRYGAKLDITDFDTKVGGGGVNTAVNFANLGYDTSAIFNIYFSF